MKVTRINKDGYDLITRFEGFSSKPYICPAGVPTIGYGTTRYYNGVKVSMSDLPISEEKGREYLMHDVHTFELAVDAMATDAVTQNQFNALVSFAYNLGPHALKSSTLLKKVNLNPNDKKIRDEFYKWVYAGGKKLEGLVRRRAAESELYFMPDALSLVA
jgi:lysozyme